MFKNLKRDGFTLIELLAIIVILAIIMVITIPNVLSAINNSRVSSLHSKAKAVATWYGDTVLADSLISTEADKTLDSGDVTKISASSNKWYCIGALSSKFTAAVDLGAADYVLTETGVGSDGAASLGTADPTSSNVTKDTCSAIRTTSSGKVEVLLVATQTGRFNVGGKTVTYALSSADSGSTVD